MNQLRQISLVGVCDALWVLLCVTIAVGGCQQDSEATFDAPIAAYRDRMLTEHAEQSPPTESQRPGPREATVRPVSYQEDLPERRALPTGPNATTQPAPAEVLTEIPDPSIAADVFAARLDALRNEYEGRRDQRVVLNYERIVNQANEYLEMVHRSNQVRLSLAECVQRTLDSNYSIRIEAHEPAISQAQIVEAEAAFDVEFFLDTSWANLDQATASTFVPGTNDTRSIEGGFRKLMPSGMQAQVSLGQTRTKNNLPEDFQTLNPAYDSSFTVQLQQPLLRGFGLDVNRSQIHLRRTEYNISQEQFIQRVRDTLVDVETAYWQLARVRRTVSILAESVAQNHITYQNMEDRLGYDAKQVEVQNARSRWQSRYVEYLEAVKLVRDAEDTLKNLMNDAEFTLAEDLEIIPSETPLVAPVVLDHFAEVRTALDRRSEIRQAREQIEATRINTMVSKNQLLPQLNLNFQYEVQGIGDTADNSFDNLTTARFISYTLGASFSYNFGERAARARWRQSRLRQSQAIVALNQITDAVVLDVNNRIRTLRVRYEQIPPQLDAVQAAERNLRALQARTQKIDPSYLETELSGVENLANTRRTLLGVIVDYNVGLINLESAKGTLLDYNNVVVTDVLDRD